LAKISLAESRKKFLIHAINRPIQLFETEI